MENNPKLFTMNQIRPWLYIGKYRETLDLELLNNYGINAMLQLAELVRQPEIICLYLAVEDGISLPPEMLKTGIEFIKSNQSEGRRVLVACGAGISRSAAFAIAALKEIEQLTLIEAYTEIKLSHPETLPHPAIWQSLCGYYLEEVPYSDMLRAGKA
jgi:hypothetical protein